MTDIVIKVQNLSKIYHLYDNHIDRLKETLHPFRKKYHHDFYALKDVDFEVKRGETIGIIGKNGSGKSTLLKILTKVLTPTSGGVEVHGRVSSLLELGAGFNPELTGLENVYFNGAIMGFTQDEIEAKLESILAFADIGDFIHQPVKTYSSGMQVRLAFAVAISVNPDILIVDEALAVGDIRFQQKCFRKLREFKKSEKTIIFVTHDMGAVINYCNAVVWLENGKIIDIGNPENICKKYIAYMAYDATTIKEKSETKKMTSKGNEDHNIEFENITKCSFFGEGGAKIQGVTLYSENSNEKRKILHGGEKTSLYVKVKVIQDIQSPLVGFTMTDAYGNKISGLNNHILGQTLRPLERGEEIIVQFTFRFPLLKNGYYSISPAVAEGTQDNHIQHHWVHDAYILQIANPNEASKMGWYFLIEEGSVNIFI